MSAPAAPLAASRRLPGMLTDAFAPQGRLLTVLDDIIGRWRGAPGHSHFVNASGLRRLCRMLVAPILQAKRCRKLPFCSVLEPPSS